MSQISATATTSREASRSGDGKFGPQATPESGVTLGSRPQPEGELDREGGKHPAGPVASASTSTAVAPGVERTTTVEHYPVAAVTDVGGRGWMVVSPEQVEAMDPSDQQNQVRYAVWEQRTTQWTEHGGQGQRWAAGKPVDQPHFTSPEQAQHEATRLSEGVDFSDHEPHPWSDPYGPGRSNGAAAPSTSSGPDYEAMTEARADDTLADRDQDAYDNRAF